VHVVGLTGGIGSGKSALASMLADLGVPVIDADEVSRRCVEPGGPGLREVVSRFGPGVLAEDGTLDRAALAAIVFADETARRDLEGILHPCIRAGIDRDLDTLRALPQPPALVIVEHPLLVETGGHTRVDAVVVVQAPSEVRVARLVADRGMSAEAVRSRMAAQADDAARRSVADHLVDNDADLEALRARARELLDRLLVEAAAGGAP